jgi:hypothetical protein
MSKLSRFSVIFRAKQPLIVGHFCVGVFVSARWFEVAAN